MFSLAKKKRKTKNYGFFKIASDEVLFDFDASIFSHVNYSPNTLIEDGEIYKIDNFSSMIFCPPWIRNTLLSTDYNDIESKDFDSISYIFQIDNLNNICFQVAANNVYLRKKGYLEFGEEVKRESGKTILLIKDYPDAYYEFNSDVLFFKNLAIIDRIFEGAANLYKVATSAEVTSFLSLPFLSIANGFGHQNVSVLNRKKISLCMDLFLKMNVIDQQNILNEIKIYKSDIYDATTGQFIIDSDEKLKFFLYGIQERYFTTPVSHERRVANSIVSI